MGGVSSWVPVKAGRHMGTYVLDVAVDEDGKGEM